MSLVRMTCILLAMRSRDSSGGGTWRVGSVVNWRTMKEMRKMVDCSVAEMGGSQSSSRLLRKRMAMRNSLR